MKTSAYFEFTRTRPDRSGIKAEWIEYVVNNPVKKIKQADGRFRMWAQIAEASGKFLRVVLLEDGETVHNAFFDRNFVEG